MPRRFRKASTRRQGSVWCSRLYPRRASTFSQNYRQDREEGDVEFTLEVDEGEQFSLRRLEFIGNSNTRDRVLRREVLINEGDPYSKQLWDY